MEICQSPEEQAEKMLMNDGAWITARAGVFENGGCVKCCKK